MRRRAAALGVAVALAVGVPAGAGTEEDPEVVDLCGPTALDERVYPGVVPWGDVCSAWFETLGGAEDDGPVVLRTTVKVAGDVGDRLTASGWTMSWELADGCQGVWTYAEHAAGHLDAPKPYASFAIRCPAEPAYPLGSPWRSRFFTALPLDVVEEDGDRVVVTLAFEGALAGAAPDHARGAVLGGPRVSTWVDFSLGFVYVDHTHPGRAYTVGGP